MFFVNQDRLVHSGWPGWAYDFEDSFASVGPAASLHSETVGLSSIHRKWTSFTTDSDKSSSLD